jgi:hypothetical protein
MPTAGDDDDDEDKSFEPAQFSLSRDEVALSKDMAAIVRQELRTAHPAFIRQAAVVLFVLERLPNATPGASITVGWSTKPQEGSREWAEVSISEEEIQASVGAHYYDPEIGGDTESETLFWAHVDGARQGSLETWSERARHVDESGILTIRDEWAGEHEIDWSSFDEE